MHCQYSVRHFLPQSNRYPTPLASKLETLALRPYKHLDWDPDSVFSINTEPMPAVAYHELETRQARAQLMERLTSTFPSLRTVIFDLHYDRVIHLSFSSETATSTGSFAVAERVDDTLDEEIWMYI